MSTMNNLFDLEEQICYVQCGYCTTILLVSVPCSSLSMVVTVRCGHCTSLLSVNMMRTSLVPLHLFAPLNQDEPKVDTTPEEVDHTPNIRSPSPVISSDEEDDDLLFMNHIVNKPPEKRQRAPSAYNRFIKDEIRRLKTMNPNMAHKQAFSTAAKNFIIGQHDKAWSGPISPQVNTMKKKERAVARERGKLQDAQMLMKKRSMQKAIVSMKERLQGIQFGQRHPLNEGIYYAIYRKERGVSFLGRVRVSISSNYLEVLARCS